MLTKFSLSSWLQKCVVMCILQRLLNGVASKWITKFYWITLAVTFVAALIVTFTECDPFKLYWQVVPDPGTHPIRFLPSVEITRDQEHVQRESSNLKSSQP